MTLVRMTLIWISFITAFFKHVRRPVLLKLDDFVDFPECRLRIVGLGRRCQDNKRERQRGQAEMDCPQVLDVVLRPMHGTGFALTSEEESHMLLR